MSNIPNFGGFPGFGGGMPDMSNMPNFGGFPGFGGGMPDMSNMPNFGGFPGFGGGGFPAMPEGGFPDMGNFGGFSDMSGMGGMMLSMFRSYSVKNYDDEIKMLKEWLLERLKVLDEKLDYRS